MVHISMVYLVIYLIICYNTCHNMLYHPNIKECLIKWYEIRCLGYLGIVNGLFRNRLIGGNYHFFRPMFQDVQAQISRNIPTISTNHMALIIWYYFTSIFRILKFPWKIRDWNMCRATFRGILGSGWSVFSMAEPRSEMAKSSHV